MKKILFIILILVCFLVSTPLASTHNHCTDFIEPEDLNVHFLVKYLKDHDWQYRVKKVCSKQLCTFVSLPHLESDIKYFIEKNIEYLEKINPEMGIEASVKGFRVEKIELVTCS